MPRGNTATIQMTVFRADWIAGLPIASLCSHYSISKDQVVRLRDLWELPLRNDRSKRRRHPDAKKGDPTPEEIRVRCLEIQKTWSDKTRQDRHWKTPTEWIIPLCEIPQNGYGMEEEQDVFLKDDLQG